MTETDAKYREIQERLARVERELAALKQKPETDYEALKKEMHDKAQKARYRLEELRKAGTDALKDARSGAEAAIVEVERTFGRIVSRFK